MGRSRPHASTSHPAPGGSPSRVAPTARRRLLRAGPAAAAILVPLLLAGGAPPALAAGGVTVTTPFPLVAVEPGSSVTFPLTVASATTAVVALAVRGLPQGWSARFTGGGLTVDGVLAGPKQDGALSLDLSIPADATGRADLVVAARAAGGSDELPLTVRVATEAGGNVALEAAYPSLRGPSSATFPFQLTLRNDTPAEATFALAGQAPAGWTVDVRPAGSSQATSLTVGSGSTGSVSVTVTPATDAAAGEYPITVTADGGTVSAQAQLTIVITGTYTMVLTTPDQVLSTDATAGQGRPFQLVVRNTGSAPVTSVRLAASPATGWNVAFDPPTISSIAAGADATVNATITPAANAVAGDYNVAFSATGAEASASETIRVTVNTSLTWAIVGVALIVLVLVGLGWVFSKYGRR